MPNRRSARYVVLLFSGCLPALLASCAPITPPSYINEIYREVLDQRFEHYRLKDGDTLTVRIYDLTGDLNQEGTIILPDGRNDLFLTDNSRIAGKTVSELEADLKARYSLQVGHADISLQVTPRGEKIYLVGQFEKPAVVDLTTKMTLGEAVSAVGGLKVTGDTDYALLRRPYVNPRRPDIFRIDLNDESEEIFLLPGDQIVLDRNFIGDVVHHIQTFITAIFPFPFYLLY